MSGLESCRGQVSFPPQFESQINLIQSGLMANALHFLIEPSNQLMLFKHEIIKDGEVAQEFGAAKAEAQNLVLT